MSKIALQIALDIITDLKNKKTPRVILIVGVVLLAVLIPIMFVLIMLLLPFMWVGELVLGINAEDILPQPIMYEWVGEYPMPCDSMTLNSDFGERDSPMHPGSSDTHTGLDFATSWHSPVVAIDNGEVIFTGYKTGYGRSVIVQHEDFQAWYAHLSNYYAVVGQEVEAGTVLGLEGGDPDKDTLAGSSTGHHLHFEIRVDGEPVDPKEYIFEIEEEEENEESVSSK